MNNKVLAESQFCTDENINYLLTQFEEKLSNEDMEKKVFSFLRNFKGYISPWQDKWETVRYLNREFINSITINPNTNTDYSTHAEFILHTEEIWP